MTAFLAAARAHHARYPRMEPQDFGKLAYQSEFGPAHLIADPERVCSALLAECGEADDAAPPPEPIGNGLCRFHLTAAHGSLGAASLLARLFAITAALYQGKGTMAGLLEKLEALHRLNIPGWTAWVEDYRRQGCPVLRHSEGFRAAYRPHYRLLRTEFAGYFPALLTLDGLARTKTPAIAALDGPCGSGKSGLAALAERVLPCQVVHMDDFYLPWDRRAPDWMDTPAGNMDLERFRDEVLSKARRGELESYRPYRCQTGQLGEPVELNGAPLTLVEGSYAHHPALAGAYDLKIFLTCSEKEQTRRLKAREGEHFPAYAQTWAPLERRYFQRCDVEEASDLVLDTSDFFT